MGMFLYTIMEMGWEWERKCHSCTYQIHINKHVRTHTHTHTHIYIYIYIYIYIHRYIFTNICICAYILAYILTHKLMMGICILGYKRVLMFIHKRTRM